MAYSNGYIFGFASLICVVCSLSVAATATGLHDLQQQNIERDLKKNILKALSVPDEGEELDGDRIDELWADRIRIAYVDAKGTAVDKSTPGADFDGDGDVDLDDAEEARIAVKGTETTPAVLPVYQRIDGDEVGAYGLPMQGKGLWGPVSTYLAVDATGSEITGATFFAPKETPGLGAEITTAWFKEQWVGKKLSRDGAPVPVRVAKGKAKVTHPDDVDYWVDGVSGATITCRGVTAMLEKGIGHYGPYLSSLRQQ